MKQLLKLIKSCDKVVVDELNGIVVIYDESKFDEIEKLCLTNDVAFDIDTMYQEKKLIIFF